MIWIGQKAIHAIERRLSMNIYNQIYEDLKLKEIVARFEERFKNTYNAMEQKSWNCDRLLKKRKTIILQKTPKLCSLVTRKEKKEKTENAGETIR